MSSRPSSARPKTSAGLRSTSARLHKPANYKNISEPLVTHMVMTSDPVASAEVIRSVSRPGTKPYTRQCTTSHSNRRNYNVMDSTQSTRLLSTTLQTPTPICNAMRPVTQQGLTGVRAVTKTGAGRFVVDKNYYISLLRAQMNSLKQEIHQLHSELSKGESDRQNLLIYEKKAEEEANEIRILQGRLMDCNKIVDMMNTNSDLREINDELSKLQGEKVLAEESLNKIVEDRRIKEERIKEIEDEIEQQKVYNNNVLNSVMYELKQMELDKLSKKKDELDLDLAKSPLKQQAMILHERLAELEAKKISISNEISSIDTPQEQRERLLQVVIRTTEEISVIDKQLNKVKEQTEQAREELREFDKEMENAAGEKNEKYHDLKLKEMQIDEFLNSYATLRAAEETRIDEASRDVLRILELLSINITSLSSINESINLKFKLLKFGENASTTEMKELCVRLQYELIKVNETEKDLEVNNKEISEEMNGMIEKMNKFENFDALKLKKEQKHMELQDRRNRLIEQLPKIQSSFRNVMKELDRTKSQLENNLQYIEASKYFANLALNKRRK
ncbi:unnamed protein product [Thelazia callipaeda]|uniref:Intraflagellar transport protein 74 homolog n=1 Tax=Thelazia callipaeda TaxID=103827 RepID=A0A0N5CRS9_THECL|nr:unnamed protein product [Thelazia callipaeda]